MLDAPKPAAPRVQSSWAQLVTHIGTALYYCTPYRASGAQQLICFHLTFDRKFGPPSPSCCKHLPAPRRRATLKEARSQVSLRVHRGHFEFGYYTFSHLMSQNPVMMLQNSILGCLIYEASDLSSDAPPF